MITLFFLNTIRHLKLSQIFYRSKEKFLRKCFFKDLKQLKDHEWKSYEIFDEKINTKFQSNFLNKIKILKLQNDWSEGSSKLWLYNLHYLMI